MEATCWLIEWLQKKWIMLDDKIIPGSPLQAAGTEDLADKEEEKTETLCDLKTMIKNLEFLTDKGFTADQATIDRAKESVDKGWFAGLPESPVRSKHALSTQEQKRAKNSPTSSQASEVTQGHSEAHTKADSPTTKLAKVKATKVKKKGKK